MIGGFPSAPSYADVMNGDMESADDVGRKVALPYNHLSFNK